MEGWQLATISLAPWGFSAVARRLIVRSSQRSSSRRPACGCSVLGLIDLHLRGEARQAAGRGDAHARPLRQRVANRFGLTEGVRRPFAAAFDRTAATDRGGMLAGLAVLPGVSLVEALVLSIMLAPAPTRHSARRSVTTSAFPRQSGKASTLRAASTTESASRLLHRAGHRRGRGRRVYRARRVAPRARGLRYGLVGSCCRDRGATLRFATRRAFVERHWLQILTVATAALAAGSRPRRRQHLHRRVHRWIRLRRDPPLQRR